MKKVLFAIPVALLLFAGYFRPITAMTQDLGRHLKTGEIIVNTHHVPKINLFSYTYPSFPFINHHYFSEVLFYLLARLGGITSLLYLTIVLIGMAWFLLYFYSARTDNTPALLLTSLLYLPILFERTDVRPELFSFLFLSICLLILYKNREKSTNLIFLLPLISLFWVNMHIYFFLSVILIGIFLFDELLRKKWQIQERSVKELAAVFLLSCIAVFINPNSISGALYPLRVFNNYGYQIEENQNVFFIRSLFHSTSTLYFEIAVVLLLLLMVMQYKKTRRIDWFLLLLFIPFGAMAVRNLPIFILGTFIIFSRYLSFFLETIFHSPLFKKFQTSLILSCILTGLLLFSAQNTAGTHTGPLVITGAGKGADFVLINHLSAPIYNNFDIGSFLDYRLYPAYRVFVDGRPEAYPASFLQNTYIPMQLDETVFKQVDQKYHFETIFFSHTDQTPWAEKFLSTIVQNPDWKIVYLDDTVIILLKNDSKNRDLIRKFGMDIKHLKESPTNTPQKQSVIQLLHFYSVVGQREKLQMLGERLLQIDPHNCSVLSLLSQLQTDPALLQMYQVQLGQFCH